MGHIKVCRHTELWLHGDRLLNSPRSCYLQSVFFIPGRANASASSTQSGSPARASHSSGSVRGVLSIEHLAFIPTASWIRPSECSSPLSRRSGLCYRSSQSPQPASELPGQSVELIQFRIDSLLRGRKASVPLMCK